MKLWTKVKQYMKSEVRHQEVITKKWYVYHWEIALIFLLGLIVTILTQIPNWVVKPINGRIDPLLSYPLRDNIIYASFSIIVTIGVSIFISVFTELGKFAGKYGSAIFILVPSILWILSDRVDDNHIDEILKTSKILGSIAFWGVVGIFILFVITFSIKTITAALHTTQKYKIRTEFLYNFLMRFNIVMFNILIVLLLGYVFLNYGVFSLHLADRTPEEIKALRKLGVSNPGPYDLQSERMITYIAVIAVIFVTLMVVIGLVNMFERPSKQLKEFEEKEKVELKEVQKLKTKTIVGSKKKGGG